MALPLADFDDGTLQGWNVTGDGMGFTFTNPGSGGNPGGYALLEDTMPGGSGGVAFAPATFRGDLRGYEKVVWDALLPPQPSGAMPLALSGAGGTFIYTPTGSLLIDVWQSWEAPLDGGPGWRQFSGTGTFSQTLAAVTTFAFILEISTTVSREAGLDNVELIPEAGAIGLLVVALTGLLIARRSGLPAFRLERRERDHGYPAAPARQ